MVARDGAALGRHGPLTPYEARARARKMLGQIDSGEDPTRRARRPTRYSHLFGVCRRWLREHIELKRKPATAAEYRRIIHRTLNPALGKVRVDRIESSGRYRASREHGRRTLRGEPDSGGPISSSLTCRAAGLSTTFQQCCAWRGAISRHRRKRPLSREELSQLWQHMAAIETTTDPYVVAASACFCGRNAPRRGAWSSLV